MIASKKQRVRAGLAMFIVLSCLGSWLVAATVRGLGLSVSPSPLGTRLFTTTLLYALMMGWQPIAAMWIVRRWIDPITSVDFGLRSTRSVFTMVGVFAAASFALLAPFVAWLATAIGVASASPLNGAAEEELSAAHPSGARALALVLAFLGTVAIVWLQAFVEEVAWRGYFLTRAMQRLGQWRGLFGHGVVWGIWYAPVVFLTSYGLVDPSRSLGRAIGVVVTCMLLGTLLGWLRLASRSVLPAVMANSTLTLAAGLPYVLEGVDTGLRSAAFGPAGWLVLMLAIACLLRTSLTSAIRTPVELVFTVGTRPRPYRRDLH